MGAYAQPYDPNEVRARIKHLNSVSFLFGVPGLILQGVGNQAVGGLMSLAGVTLLVIGLSYYARSRGRSPWFAALGLLSCLGLLILALLPKRCVVCGGPSAAGQCTQCGAPVAP
jgi:hypothetical protein